MKYVVLSKNTLYFTVSTENTFLRETRSGKHHYSSTSTYKCAVVVFCCHAEYDIECVIHMYCVA